MVSSHTHTLSVQGASDYKQIKTDGPHQATSNIQAPLCGGTMGVCVFMVRLAIVERGREQKVLFIKNNQVQNVFTHTQRCPAVPHLFNDALLIPVSCRHIRPCPLQDIMEVVLHHLPTLCAPIIVHTFAGRTKERVDASHKLTTC